MARLAVIAHRKGAYLEIPGIYDVVKQIAEQESEKEPEDKTALELLHEGNHYIARDSDVARFLLRKQRKPYFKEFVPSGTISLENLQTDSKQGVVNYLWFVIPQNRSSLCCRDRGLEGDYGAFGVRRVLSGEASAKNSSGNSLTEIAKAHSTVIPAVLEQTGFNGAIELVKRPLTRGLIAKLRGQ